MVMHGYMNVTVTIETKETSGITKNCFSHKQVNPGTSKREIRIVYVIIGVEIVGFGFCPEKSHQKNWVPFILRIIDSKQLVDRGINSRQLSISTNDIAFVCQKLKRSFR